MQGNATLTVLFTRAKRDGSRVYVETVTSSVIGMVETVHTDGVEILRDGGLITALSYDKIQVAEEILDRQDRCRRD